MINFIKNILSFLTDLQQHNMLNEHNDRFCPNSNRKHFFFSIKLMMEKVVVNFSNVG